MSKSANSEYLQEQAARCRRLSAHILDREVQRRLLDLAEEYEREAAELAETEGNGQPARARRRADAPLAAGDCRA